MVQISSGFAPQGVLSGRARASFPPGGARHHAELDEETMTSTTATAGSDADRRSVLDVLARSYQAWEAGDANTFVAD